MPSTDQPAWEVTGQMPDTGLNESNVFVQGITVTYRTRSGATGKVFVPQQLFTADHVREVVAAAAAHSEAVSNLRG